MLTGLQVCSVTLLKAKDPQNESKQVTGPWTALTNQTDPNDNVLLNSLVILSHPLHDLLLSYRSAFSERLTPPERTAERHRKSFLPVAIRPDTRLLTLRASWFTLDSCWFKEEMCNNSRLLCNTHHSCHYLCTICKNKNVHTLCYFCMYLNFSYDT